MCRWRQVELASRMRRSLRRRCDEAALGRTCRVEVASRLRRVCVEVVSRRRGQETRSVFLVRAQRTDGRESFSTQRSQLEVVRTSSVCRSRLEVVRISCDCYACEEKAIVCTFERSSLAGINLTNLPWGPQEK